MDILQHIFSRPDQLPAADGEAYLLVGLGNPGREHKGNRHNIGFMAVDAIAEAHGVSLSKVQHRAVTADFRLGESKVILAKPQTWMNKSGDAVGPLAKFYKLSPSQVLVIYDELDLEFGTVRIREKGSAAGHNGMRSIINHLGQDFPRMRLGIGRPPGRMPVHAYVLQDFDKNQLPVVADMLNRSVRAAETFVREGITLAMSRYNGKVTE